MIEIEVPSFVIFRDNKKLKAVLRSAGSEIAQKARQLIRQTTREHEGAKTPPGSPPQSRTGELARSLKVSPSRDGESVTIKDTAYYSRFLELGAKGGGGVKGTSNKKGIRGTRNKRGVPGTSRVMPPHPFLQPAADAVIENGLPARIVKAIIEDIKLKQTK